MAFQLITTAIFTGRPSLGKAKLQIWLGKTCLVATDGWSNYPAMELVLHPDHLPHCVVRAKHELIRRIERARGRGTITFDPTGFRYIVPNNIAIGDKKVPIRIRYGRWTEEKTVIFDGPVTRLETA